MHLLVFNMHVYYYTCLLLYNKPGLYIDQDLLALKVEYTTRPAVEETINDPTNPKHYWRFREYMFLSFSIPSVRNPDPYSDSLSGFCDNKVQK